MSYHAEFGRSALKDVGLNTEVPRTLESAGTPFSWFDGKRDCLQDTRTSPTCVTTSNLLVLRQRVYAQIEGNLQNWGALGRRPPGVGRG